MRERSSSLVACSPRSPCTDDQITTPRDAVDGDENEKSVHATTPRRRRGHQVDAIEQILEHALVDLERGDARLRRLRNAECPFVDALVEHAKARAIEEEDLERIAPPS